MSWRPEEGDQLILTGEWAVFKGNREFAFKTARLDIPTQPRDQLHYVCTRTKRLGAAAEELIWSHYGDDWQNADGKTVPRLAGRVYEEFRLQIESLNDKSQEAGVVAALMGKGATIAMATAAWTRWKLETMGVVGADCYRLAELDGYGFKDVDIKIRVAYGIADGDPRRIRAGVICALRRLTDKGDTLVMWDDLYKHAAGMLAGHNEMIGEVTGAMFEDGTLKAFADCSGVALAADWDAECAIWDFVCVGYGDNANRENAPQPQNAPK